MRALLEFNDWRGVVACAIGPQPAPRLLLRSERSLDTRDFSRSTADLANSTTRSGPADGFPIGPRSASKSPTIPRTFLEFSISAWSFMSFSSLLSISRAT